MFNRAGSFRSRRSQRRSCVLNACMWRSSDHCNWRRVQKLLSTDGAHFNKIMLLSLAPIKAHNGPLYRAGNSLFGYQLATLSSEIPMQTAAITASH